MHLHEIEPLDAEPSQAALDVAAHGVGRIVGVERAVDGAQRAALREHEGSLRSSGERLGDDLLRPSPAVHRRRVDPPHASVDGRPHGTHGGLAILRTPPVWRRAVRRDRSGPEADPGRQPTGERHGSNGTLRDREVVWTREPIDAGTRGSTWSTCCPVSAEDSRSASPSVSCGPSARSPSHNSPATRSTAASNAGRLGGHVGGVDRLRRGDDRHVHRAAPLPRVPREPAGPRPTCATGCSPTSSACTSRSTTRPRPAS